MHIWWGASHCPHLGEPKAGQHRRWSLHGRWIQPILTYMGASYSPSADYMSLRFRPEVLPRIREGNITMQFGLWRRPRVVAGRVYVIPGLGTLRVTAVEKIDLSRITPWEAEASGAEDVAQLREWLKEEKPDADVEEGMCYRVRFRFLGP